jgi:hypothetical protein
MVIDEIENIQIVEAPNDKFPRCPYCKSTLDKIWAKSQGIGWVGKKLLLMCPYCEAFLGYNAWKRG